MGRNRAFAEDAVLAAAGEAFVRGGYEGTSIDALVAALGVHRGSLYNAFGSKRGLFVAVLRHHIRTRLAPLSPTPDRPARRPDELAQTLSRGPDLDLLLVAAIERGHGDAEVASLLRAALNLLDDALAEHVSVSDPRPAADRPVRALDLLGARLYHRLHPDSDDIPAPHTSKEE